jgi:hypothetical protein
MKVKLIGILSKKKNTAKIIKPQGNDVKYSLISLKDWAELARKKDKVLL